MTWCYQDFMINSERIVESMRMITNHVIFYTAHCPNSLSECIWYLLLQEEWQNQVDQAERESVPLHTLSLCRSDMIQSDRKCVCPTQVTVQHNLPNITTEIAVNLVPRLDWCSSQFAIAQTLVDRPDPHS